MSEPSPLPPLPEPFAAEPRPLRSPGCGRGALIGCGALTVLFGVAGVLLALNANRILVWMMQRIETRIEAKLPADVTPAERQRLTAAFADLYQAIDEGRMQPTAVQALQRELFEMAQEIDRGLTRDQVRRLTVAVEEAAGRPPRPDAGTG